MDRRGVTSVTPRYPDPSLPTEPFINLSSGYVTRTAAVLPKQGTTKPWRLHQNYFLDLMMFRYGKLDREVEWSGKAA